MEHFGIAQWADYVRGVCVAPEKAAMERHLAEGCDACRHLMALMQRVYEESSAETVVPAELVEAAKAVFPAARSRELPPWREFPRLSARLVLENFPSALEGARALSDALVQAVYHAGDYAIEIQVEREPESPHLTLVGQLVNRAGSGAPLSGAVVLAVSRKKVVSQVQTNRFGEFCMTLKMQRGVTLRIQLDDISRRVEIPLTRVLTGRR